MANASRFPSSQRISPLAGGCQCFIAFLAKKFAACQCSLDPQPPSLDPVTDRMTRPLLLTLALAAATCAAQTNDTESRLRALEESLGQLDAKLSRQINLSLWFQRLGDIARVDVVHFTGPPPRTAGDPAPSPGSNEV